MNITSQEKKRNKACCHSMTFS